MKLSLGAFVVRCWDRGMDTNAIAQEIARRGHPKGEAWVFNNLPEFRWQHAAPIAAPHQTGVSA